MALAAVEAAVGDIPRALHLAKTVSRSMRRYAYGDMLEVLINAVDIGNSDRVLREMKEEWLLDSYAWRLQRLTREQSKAGYYKRALDLARSQVSPLLQANALVGVANGLMDWKDVPIIPGLGQSHATYDKGELDEF